MSFCLDTNVVIAALNGRPTSVRERLNVEIAGGATIGIPAIVIFEMRYGAAKSDRKARNDAALDDFLSADVEVWTFDSEDAAHAGEIRAHLERDGQPIGAYDCLIAAQARRRNATLVTANHREFRRVPGLHVIDWAE